MAGLEDNHVASRVASGMSRGATKDGRGRVVVVVGAAIGLALGVGVSLTIDVPLAPEAGLVIGVLVGWFSRRIST